MSLPDVSLQLSLDPDSLTLDDLELFEAGGFSVARFKKFLASHSNWTPAQVGALTLSEFRRVAEMIGDHVREMSVPKASGAS